MSRHANFYCRTLYSGHGLHSHYITSIHCPPFYNTVTSNRYNKCGYNHSSGSITIAVLMSRFAVAQYIQYHDTMVLSQPQKTKQACERLSQQTKQLCVEVQASKRSYNTDVGLTKQTQYTMRDVKDCRHSDYRHRDGKLDTDDQTHQRLTTHSQQSKQAKGTCTIGQVLWLV